MKPPIPGGKDEIGAREHQGRREVHGVKAAQLMLEGQVSGALYQGLVHLDDAEGRPLGLNGSRGPPSGGQVHGPHGLHKPVTTHEPSLRPAHRITDEVTPGLRDVALHQGARVQV